jgi:L-threonylcarbamoyladenylate synthase
MSKSQNQPANSRRQAAVFLDRDGTIIEDRGHLADPADIVFFPETFEALSALQKHFRLFIVTNQSGVAKGLLSMDAVQRVNRHVLTVLRDRGIEITDIYICPHQRQDNCMCIKPNPFFPEKAASEHGIDLRRSFSIGDHPCDAQLALQCGGQGLYLLTGHGSKHLDEVPLDVPVLPNIRAAAEWILSGCHAAQATDKTRNISRAADIIRRGGLAAFPTETVYGLGADALNVQAVARIYEVKKRPTFDPLIIHIAACTQLKELVTQLPQEAQRLIDAFWPGPLTIVLPKSEIVPDLVTAGLPTAAIRMPAHPDAREMIEKAGCPVAAPSANLFGSVSPTCAEHVRQQLGQSVDFILDGGLCRVGIESTIVTFAEPRPVLLRPGGITLEQIEAVIGPVTIADRSDHRPLSPGRLERHYAPRTPLRIVESLNQICPGMRVGLLSLGPTEHVGCAAVEVLSLTGSLSEAAANLFAAMRRLDEANLDLIVTTGAPNHGLGRAINDRLYRAGQK